MDITENINVKRNHHYVWQYYLKPWTHDDSKIFCLHKGSNNTFTSHTKNVAYERDFYTLNPLTVEDLFYIKKLAVHKKSLERIEALNTWNSVYEMLFAIQRLYDSFEKNESVEVCYFKKLKQRLEFQVLEDMHCVFENLGISYLNHIRNNNNIDFAKNLEDKNKFILFLLVQYVRTDKMKKNICRQMSKNAHKDEIADTISRHWCLISINSAISLTQSVLNYKIIILNNNTEIAFITCDQPVLNTDSMSDKITELELYYPVTTNIAILLTCPESAVMSRINQELDKTQVELYNNLIIQMASKHIFTSSQIQIDNIKNIFIK